MVLQWTQEQHPPCPLGWRTAAGAVGGGHLAVLQWLWEQGDERMSFTKRTYVAKNEEVKSWLREHGCPTQ